MEFGKKKVQNIFTIFFDYTCNLDLGNQWSAWFHSPNRIKDSGEINEDPMIWNLIRKLFLSFKAVNLEDKISQN